MGEMHPAGSTAVALVIARPKIGLRVGAEMNRVPLAQVAILRGILAHRREHDPVVLRQSSQGDGRVVFPPEKWSSLMYGLWPDGGLKKGKEATHRGRDRHQASAG